MEALFFADSTQTHLQKTKNRGLISARSPPIAASAPKTRGGVDGEAARRADSGAGESRFSPGYEFVKESHVPGARPGLPPKSRRVPQFGLRIGEGAPRDFVCRNMWRLQTRPLRARPCGRGVQGARVFARTGVKSRLRELCAVARASAKVARGPGISRIQKGGEIEASFSGLAFPKGARRRS